MTLKVVLDCRVCRYYPISLNGCRKRQEIQCHTYRAKPIINGALRTSPGLSRVETLSACTDACKITFGTFAGVGSRRDSGPILLSRTYISRVERETFTSQNSTLAPLSATSVSPLVVFLCLPQCNRVQTAEWLRSTLGPFCLSSGPVRETWWTSINGL